MKEFICFSFIVLSAFCFARVESRSRMIDVYRGLPPRNLTTDDIRGYPEYSNASMTVNSTESVFFGYSNVSIVMNATSSAEFSGPAAFGKPPLGKIHATRRGEPPESYTVPIKFTIFPVFLENVDVRLATCRIHIYIVKEWRDERLSWDPRKYGLSGGIRIDPKNIWIPDFEPYNGLGASSTALSYSAQAYISSAGNVRLSQFYILTTYGLRSKGLFLPVCEMRFASWTAGRFKIANSDNFDFSRYTPSVQWARKSQDFRVRNHNGYPEARAKIFFVSR